MTAPPEGCASQSRGRPAGFIAGWAIVLCFANCPAFISAEQTPPASRAVAGAETLVVQITLNGVNKGQFFVSVIDGDFLVRLQDLNAMGLIGLGAKSRTLEGEQFASLKGIAGLAVTFDERRQVLDLSADPKLLPRQTVDFATGRKQ